MFTQELPQEPQLDMSLWPRLKCQSSSNPETRSGAQILVDNTHCYDNIKTRIIITDSIVDKNTLIDLRKDTDAETRLTIYTQREIEFFRVYRPVTYLNIRNKFELSNLPDCLVEPFALNRNAYLELCDSLTCAWGPIDSVYFYTKDNNLLGTLASKFRLYNSLVTLFASVGLANDNIKIERLPNNDSYEFVELKQKIIALAKLIPQDLFAFDNVKKDFDRNKFGYIDNLKQILGDNLISVIAYGSSVYVSDDTGFSDYDNWIIVRDLRTAYHKLSALGGFINYNGHAVNFNLLSYENAEHALFTTVSPLLKDRALLYGDIKFPECTKADLNIIGLQTASSRLINARSSCLNTFFLEPKVLIDKENLFKSITAIPSQILLRSILCLSQSRESSPLIKNKCNLALEKFGFSIPKEIPTTEAEIRERLLDATIKNMQFINLAIQFIS